MLKHGAYLRPPRLRLAPAGRWPVGLRTVRWMAVTPFLKHVGQAHGNVGDLNSGSGSLALPRQLSELWKTAVQKLCTLVGCSRCCPAYKSYTCPLQARGVHAASTCKPAAA